MTVLTSALLASALIVTTRTAVAGTTTYSGNLGDPANTALVFYDLTAPLFDNANDIANNIALYTLVVPVAEPVTFTSTGFAAGGIDPYFTLFAGAGTSAIFLDSNYTQAFSTGGDFSLTDSLSAGTYQFAIGVNPNESFAENQGSGTLADGFVGLGAGGTFGTGAYAINVTMAVPEPAQWSLLLTGAAFALVLARRRSRGTLVPQG